MSLESEHSRSSNALRPGHTRSTSSASTSLSCDERPPAGMVSRQMSTARKNNPPRNSTIVQTSPQLNVLQEFSRPTSRSTTEERPLHGVFRMESPKWSSRVPPEQLGMKILNPDEQDVCVDLVAVHGLGAMPDITWTHKTSGVNWLKDLLPSQMPKTRILRFGYDSLWLGRDPIRTSIESIATLLLNCLKRHRKECPHRPIIFLGHCFGGLVIEAALCRANLAKHKWPYILDATVGVAFLGTPHRGSDSFGPNGGMSHANILALIAASSYLKAEFSVVKYLDNEHRTLLDVSSSFLAILSSPEMRDRIDISCFYESRAASIEKITGVDVTEFIVGQGSASIDGYYPIELSCDHFTINKYDTLSDGNLQLIISELTEMLDKAMERCPMPSPAPISLWSPNDAQSINSQPSPDQMVRRTNTAPPIQGHPSKAQLPYRTEGIPYAPSLVSYNSRASSNSGTGDQSERDLRQQAMYRPSNANLSNAYSPPQQDMHPQKQDMYSQQETRPQPDIYSQQWMYPPREIVAEDSISSHGHSSVSGYDGYNARNEAYRSPTTTVHIQGVCTCPECTSTREKDERRMTIMSQLKLKYGSDPVPQERQWKQDLIVNSPLYAAVFFSDPGLVHELLHCGEDLNFQDERVPSGTVLQLAAFKGDEAMVKLLVAHGALIDQEGGEYGSALQAAASEGHVNTVRMLLELNDESDMEPLDLNRQTGSTKTALQAAAAAGHTEIVRILLEQDLDVDQSDAQHESALHQAAANNHLEAIELLLGKGAEILLPGPNGSALDNAIYQGHEEAAMMLLAGGAKIDVDNDKSAVAMKHALKYNHGGVVNLILSHDAHKDAKIKKLAEHPVVQVPSPRNVPTGLSSLYQVPQAGKSFFQVGSVIEIVWSPKDALAAKGSESDDDLSDAEWNGKRYPARRYIIAKQRQEWCYAFLISSFHGKTHNQLRAMGFHDENLDKIFMKGTRHAKFQLELLNDDLRVEPEEGRPGAKLHEKSRVDYRDTYMIKYSTSCRKIGHLTEGSLSRFAKHGKHLVGSEYYNCHHSHHHFDHH